MRYYGNIDVHIMILQNSKTSHSVKQCEAFEYAVCCLCIKILYCVICNHISYNMAILLQNYKILVISFVNVINFNMWKRFNIFSSIYNQ